MKSLVEAYPLPSGEGREVLLVCAKLGRGGGIGSRRTRLVTVGFGGQAGLGFEGTGKIVAVGIAAFCRYPGYRLRRGAKHPAGVFYSTFADVLCRRAAADVLEDTQKLTL